MQSRSKKGCSQGMDVLQHLSQAAGWRVTEFCPLLDRNITGTHDDKSSHLRKGVLHIPFSICFLR